jgi:hypothetical protein
LWKSEVDHLFWFAAIYSTIKDRLLVKDSLLEVHPYFSFPCLKVLKEKSVGHIQARAVFRAALIHTFGDKDTPSVPSRPSKPTYKDAVVSYDQPSTSVIQKGNSSVDKSFLELKKMNTALREQNKILLEQVEALTKKLEALPLLPDLHNSIDNLKQQLDALPTSDSQLKNKIVVISESVLSESQGSVQFVQKQVDSLLVKSTEVEKRLVEMTEIIPKTLESFKDSEIIPFKDHMRKCVLESSRALSADSVRKQFNICLQQQLKEDEGELGKCIAQLFDGLAIKLESKIDAMLTAAISKRNLHHGKPLFPK